MAKNVGVLDVIEQVKRAEKEAKRRVSFKPDGHSYKLDNENIWSITTILGDLNPIPEHILSSEKFMEACDFGTKVHQLTEGDDRGHKRRPNIMPRLADVADSWKEYVEANEIQMFAIEIPVFSDKHWFSGTADRICLFEDEIYLIDLKSGAYNSRHAQQISAYVMAARERGIHIDQGAVVSLKDGVPKMTKVKLIKSTAKWMESLLKYTDIQHGMYYG